MEFRPDRRRWLKTAAGLTLALPALPTFAATPTRPFRIYAVLFRGMTDVEKGFEDYLASRKVPVQITYRNLNRDPAKMPGFLEEIRATRPDLVYTWGTSVTLGVVGPYDGVIRGQHITEFPVVFTLVGAPVLAKIVRDMQSPGRNVTGVINVAPTATQIRGMASYRKFKTLGVLYTPTERNSVVIVEELRRLGQQTGFHTIDRTFRLDASRKPIVDGAADLVGELKEAGAEWLYLPPDSYLGTVAQEVVIPAAMQLGLPTFASTEQLMQAGALCGLVCRYYNIGQLTAYKAEQILVAKTPPSQIVVETLKRFSYQISMPVARKLKLPPPLPMMAFAELITSEAPPPQY
jgi:putative ABC transport system substrate-binding protein